MLCNVTVASSIPITGKCIAGSKFANALRPYCFSLQCIFVSQLAAYVYISDAHCDSMKVTFPVVEIFVAIEKYALRMAGANNGKTKTASPIVISLALTFEQRCVPSGRCIIPRIPNSIYLFVAEREMQWLWTLAESAH